MFKSTLYIKSMYKEIKNNGLGTVFLPNNV